MQLDLTSDLVNLDSVLPSLNVVDGLLSADSAAAFIDFPLYTASAPTSATTVSTVTDSSIPGGDSVSSAGDHYLANAPDHAPLPTSPSASSTTVAGFAVPSIDRELDIDVGGRPIPVTKEVTKKRPPSNVSHTRRCRAKVNSKLQDLLAVLPQAARAAGALHAEGGEDKELDGAKHKAQILGLAISRFHALRMRNTELEMKLAMSSPHHMRRWVRSIVQGSLPFNFNNNHSNISTVSTTASSAFGDPDGPDIVRCLKSFMALICVTRSWKYAELWQPQYMDTDNTHLKYISGAFPQTLGGEEIARLRRYRASSRKFKFVPRSGVPGRVFLTKRPEWLPSLDDPIAFPRAPHAVAQQVQVTFAVPVIIRGQVSMVVEFYDTVQRPYDPAIVSIANEVAAMFGNCFEENLPSHHTVVSKVL